MFPHIKPQIDSPPKASARYRVAVVWFAIWSLLRLPVAVPDFHEVEHHHADGAECLYHEHLNRWHGEGSQSPHGAESVLQHDPAQLHWHWVIPGTSVPDGSSDPLGRDGTVENLIGLSLTSGPGTDSLSRMLESANQAAIVKHAALDRFDGETVVAHSFLDASFCAGISLCHSLRFFLTSIVETPGIRTVSFAPLRC